MLLTKREEQLLKAFLEYGRLSVNQLTDILQVSKRTTYRTLTDLTESLNTLQVGILKEGGKYFLSGSLEQLHHYQYQKSYSPKERLSFVALTLLMSEQSLTNETLQEMFTVSNVTVIQDIATIEERFNSFGLVLNRQGGYLLEGDSGLKRWLAAVILTEQFKGADFNQLEHSHYLSLRLNNFKLHSCSLKKLENIYQTMIRRWDNF